MSDIWSINDIHWNFDDPKFEQSCGVVLLDNCYAVCFYGSEEYGYSFEALAPYSADAYGYAPEQEGSLGNWPIPQIYEALYEAEASRLNAMIPSRGTKQDVVDYINWVNSFDNRTGLTADMVLKANIKGQNERFHSVTQIGKNKVDIASGLPKAISTPARLLGIPQTAGSLEPFTIHDFNWGSPNHFFHAHIGTILMPNAYALYFEQMDAEPRDIPVANATFLVKTLRPYGVSDPAGDFHRKETLVLAAAPEIGIPQLKYDYTATKLSTDDLINIINRLAQLEDLWHKDTPYHHYVLQGNVLDRNPNMNPRINITQAWKTPVNHFTGELVRETKGWTAGDDPGF